MSKERATPNVAFSVRLEPQLYEELHDFSLRTGHGKSKTLNMALEEYLKKRKPTKTG